MLRTGLAAGWNGNGSAMTHAPFFNCSQVRHSMTSTRVKTAEATGRHNFDAWVVTEEWLDACEASCERNDEKAFVLLEGRYG